jgi:hypothetical protein
LISSVPEFTGIVRAASLRRTSSVALVAATQMGKTYVRSTFGTGINNNVRPMT